jgi:hypothetical protein
MAENKKCAHPACNCMATKDSKYCSQYCQDAKGTLEIECGCGHAGCAEQAATSTSGAPTF